MMNALDGRQQWAAEKVLEMRMLRKKKEQEMEAQLNKVKARRLDMALTLFTAPTSMMSLPTRAEGF